MDDDLPRERGARRAGQRLVAARDWLDATPAELVGLGVLLVGAAVASVLLWLGSAPQPAPLAMPTVGGAPAPRPTELVVHVAGAVVRPGVVRLAEGDRVGDAIDAAGGPAPKADLTGLNLARPVSDGEQVLVPKAGAAGTAAAAEAGEEAGEEGGVAQAAPSAWRPDGRLDINLATAEDLEELPGIGPVLAERVLAYRDEHGPFEDVGELREVAGIGERTLANLADLVTV